MGDDESTKPLEYRNAHRLPVYTVVSSSATTSMPINLQMLRSGFQFEPDVSRLGTGEVQRRPRTTSERLRDFHEMTLQAVAQASSRPRANSTHTCAAPSAVQQKQLQQKQEEQHRHHQQRHYHHHQEQKEQQQQQQQQRFFASNGSADMAASRPVPTATAAMHALNLRSTVSCSTPFPSSSSSALTATTAAATSTSGIGRVPKTSSTLEGSVLVRDPAGLHLPPTIVNHAFLRSGAQFTEPQLEVARNSSILGVSNDNAAAGDQNEMHLHRSRNRRLEEFYERMQQQHAKPA
ncbi:hypothetical protein PTSG_04824 [Salpingoeca rosetta]|uniref:Uncharacterized protein n=1 Tax=Salpingoeca rosetta (strain ATCC 50818 / BSB-021) TaxID=946362 RepID=F2U9T3_SALR5|nr:uncharacterized protein PTSG_04824 [Salpingoeca rosetta]EGD73110.1 hypothetical protein PTSG_04824 [Salpingoeca rosetta]|eukprot:XP_004994141.1 hypothetical protein PTSG_04824 [Salpingoeca rosetta]